MPASTVSLGKSFVQLCLLTCISLLYMKGGPTTAQCTAAQTMELWNSKDRRQHCTAQAQVLEIYKGHPVNEAPLHTKETIML